MASVEKLPAMSKFLFLVALLLLLLWGDSHAQQPYVNNQQLACENQNSNITKGYYCNSPQKSCQSYITFRSTPSYDSAVAIGYLLNATATLITSLNNFSDDFSAIPHNTLVLVPVDCSCSGGYYQHNSSYIIRYQTETYFIISNNTYQGLTTCQAMIAQNPYNYKNLKVGNSLLVPLRCACPTSGQVAAGFKYLLSYLVTWGDSVSAIAAKFGADEKSVMDANELSDGDVIFPFTPILVPLPREPKIIEQQQTSPPPAPPPQTPTVVGESKSSKKWVFVGVAAAASSLLLLSLFGFIFCLYRRRSRKPKPLLESAPPPLPAHKFSDSSDYPPSLSSQGIRYEIESLTLYKFEDIQAATGNFNESNRIKGSVYRASFKDDDAAVKVMKGDVSAEINLLKKINHTNIIRLSGFCLHEGSSYLVYQYAEKGSVSDWLQSNKHQTSYTLSWQQRVRIAYDVADALNYLHNYTNPSYIHKNLKTSNILLDENLRAKVANFGLARTMDNGNEGGLQLTRHVVGTQGYLAPEYIANGVITPKLDVFAFGVVMLELLSGREAADAEKSGGGEMLSASIERVLEGDNVREKLQGFMDPCLQHEYPLELAFSMAQLAKNCVARDLNARPSTAEVLVTLSKILSSSLDWDPSDELNSSTSMSSNR